MNTDYDYLFLNSQYDVLPGAKFLYISKCDNQKHYKAKCYSCIFDLLRLHHVFILSSQLDIYNI